MFIFKFVGIFFFLKMRYNQLFMILFCVMGGVVQGQQKIQQIDTLTEKLVIMEGDTLLLNSIPLDEVFVFGKLKFGSYEDKLRYYILQRKTIKVYPYAKLAAERLVQLNDSLSKIKSKSKKRRYTKEVQKYIEGEFSDELKKLTRTEGQILVKLIYRQTGKTAFNLVKELRNGWRAFWYNTTAKLFKISIKEEFHPDLVYEDYLIEDILQRAFADYKLERQKSALDYDFAVLTNKWISEQK